TLTHVGFDPTTRCLTHIGVKQGRLFGKTVYLPFDTVVGATGDGVTLRITGAELAASKVKPSGALLDGKSVIEREGATGKGTILLMAVRPENGELAYIVVHHLRPGQDTLLLTKFVTKL